MKKTIVGAVLLVFVAAQLSSQSPVPEVKKDSEQPAHRGACGFPYGKGFWFSFCAPNGWIVDNSIARDSGLNAVVYPAASSWDSATQSGTFMYYSTSQKKDESATVSRLMVTDAAEVKRHDQSAVVKKGEPIQVDGIGVPVQLFAPGGYSRFEAVAYIDSPNVVIMFVMSSKSEDIFKRDYEAFVRLVQSYKFQGTEVTIKDK
ncbi:MAG: hypothetical protein ACLP07_02680 [Terracidiphilus sp.]